MRAADLLDMLKMQWGAMGAGLRDSVRPVNENLPPIDDAAARGFVPPNVSPQQVQSYESQRSELYGPRPLDQTSLDMMSPGQRIGYGIGSNLMDLGAGLAAFAPVSIPTGVGAGVGLIGEGALGLLGLGTSEWLKEQGRSTAEQIGGDILASTLAAGPVGMVTGLGRNADELGSLGLRVMRGEVELPPPGELGELKRTKNEELVKKKLATKIAKETGRKWKDIPEDELNPVAEEFLNRVGDSSEMRKHLEEIGLTTNQIDNLVDGFEGSGSHRDAYGPYRQTTAQEIAEFFHGNHGDPMPFKDGVPQGTPEQLARFEDNLASEVEHAIGLHPEAAGWYDDNISLTYDVLDELDPDLASPENRAVFDVLLAVTSNGNVVGDQFNQTWRAYNQWKKTGQIPLDKTFYSGKEVTAISNGLKTHEKIAKKLGGYGAAAEWMRRTGTIKELRESLVNELGWTKKQASKIGTGESVNEVVNFSNIFGPKLGSFYGNLNGNFDTVTMDRWFMRTMGRNAGNQMDPVSPEKARDMRARLMKAIDAYPDAQTTKFGKEKLGFKEEMTAAEFDEVSKAAGKHFTKESNRAGIVAGTPADEFRLAVNNYYKTFDPRVEAPNNASHRQWIRERMGNVQNKLRANGKTLNNADLQALLWYAEKELYGQFGYKAKEGASDYAAAAAELYESVAGRPSERYARGTGRVGAIGRSTGGQ